MLTYPHFNPVAFHLGPIEVHWYGIMYLISFIVGWFLANYRARQSQGQWTSEAVADLIFYVALGVIVGGRLGYMLFYDFSQFIHQPWIIVKVWEGGMSFHGGFLGVLFMIWLWTRKYKKSFIEVTDFIAPIVPIGLAAGRLGNFINGEILGRMTTVPWRVVYPLGGPFPRHPISIYEFLLEGIALFIILWIFSAKPRPKMAVSGLFLLGYGVFRCFCECFRQPDPQLGFIAFGWLTMGELLSIPMILGGVFILWYVYRYRKD